MMLYLCVSVVTLLLQPVVSVTYNCSAQHDRVPDNSDLTVDCGTSMIVLEVNMCTAQWAGFDPSSLAMNGQHNNSQCVGNIDTSVDPPVIRYQLPVNHSQNNPCRQSLQIVNEVPDQSGPFSFFSTIQSVIITGFIDTPSSSVGIISYSTDLYYHFSCRYPLEYLLNNTKIVASSVSVATSDNNGTFIDTLSMSVYNDTNYTYPLTVPATGLELRTKIYVEVKATNLTGNFNVLLDHCFATPSAYNMSNSDKHSFFTGCSVDLRTKVTTNGLSTNAKFNFEAFRFVEHRDQDKSSTFIHCILRLCEPNKCQELLNACRRRKRSVMPFGTESSDSATVSVGPLYTAREVDLPAAAAYGGGTQTKDSKGDVTGLVVGIVFGTAAVALLVLGGWFIMKKFYWAGGLPHAFN
ncbi:zona pellucida-like domain-containing protein 1 [Hypomesus transpacificus]|uniref:zona pellucida-like domain-containing protein 1 n=1 Tax=Hypomesus transpacificus TaxID=137520 RepID=UPI001F074375|nr:zona pellucida-like domain-containing protein 1 [Hypomesus transpacificus]